MQWIKKIITSFKPIIKNLIIEISDWIVLLLIILSRKSLSNCLFCMPLDRSRYLKYYFNEFRQIANPTTFKFNILILLRRNFSIISSDNHLNKNAIKLLNLNSINSQILIWNDFFEIEYFNYDINSNFIFLFSDHSSNSLPNKYVISPKCIKPKTKSRRYKFKKNKIILFVGHFKKEKIDNKTALKFYNMIIANQISYSFLFSEEYFSNFTDTVTALKSRSKIINALRFHILTHISAKFEGLLVIYSNSDSEILHASMRPANYGSAIHTMIRRANVNLDLLSKCGAEKYYPRSLEILEFNPDSIVQLDSKLTLDKALYLLIKNIHKRMIFKD